MGGNYGTRGRSAPNFPLQQTFATQGEGNPRCNVPGYTLPVGSEQIELRSHKDSSMAYEALQPTTPANFQSQVAQAAQLNASGYHLPIVSEHGGFGLQGDGSLVYDLSRFVVPANPQDQVAQFNASSCQLPIGTRNDTYAVQQYGAVGHLPSRSVAAQPDELRPSSFIPPRCPVCNDKFSRVQDRNRHVESHLPPSIYCPFRDCHWTGRRQSHFKEHWDRDHSKTDKAPEIYDPKEFVKQIVDGTSPADVEQAAFLKAQEKLVKLGKEDVGEKLSGRNKK